MELILNPYVKNLTNKFLTPLLKENGCQNLEPQLKTWWFNIAQIPDSTEWSRLTNYNLNLGSQERTTLPITGKLKLQENKISLQLFMKFIKIKTINEEDIKDIDNKYATEYQRVYGTEPRMLMIEATTTGENYQEEYYTCNLEIGTCTKTVLTNRAQKLNLVSTYKT